MGDTMDAHIDSQDADYDRGPVGPVHTKTKTPSIETSSIQVIRYRDVDGEPTCAAQFPNHVCDFYRTKRFGTSECCAFDVDNTTLKRRKGGEGTLIPDKACCVIWKDQNVKLSDEGV